MPRIPVVVVVVVGLAALAAPARADDCEVAKAQLARKDLVRASIAASLCEDAGDDRAAALVAEVEKTATARGYSPVEIVTDPAGGTVVVEPAPDVPFTAPRRVWLPEGRHQVTGLVDGTPVATALVVAREGNRAAALIELPPPPPPPGTREVDFGEEGGGEMTSGPPPKVVHPSLLPERYLRGVEATGDGDGGARAQRPHVWTLSIGPVLGTVAGDGGAAYGAAFGIHHGFELTPAVTVMPEIYGQVLSVTDPMGERVAVVGVHADTAAQVHARLGARWRGSVRAGPSFSFDKGLDAFDGVTLGAAAAAEVERDRRHVLALRVEVPFWTGAEDRMISAGLFLGHRW